MPTAGLFRSSTPTASGVLGAGAPDANFFAAASGRGGSGAAPQALIPGPLGQWQLDAGRDHGGLGRFAANLTPNPTFEAGGFSPYAAGGQRPPEQGFFEHVVGGLFGLTGNETLAGAGRFLGSALDFPIEATGNVLGLPLGLATSAPTLGRQGGLDPEFQKQLDDAFHQNPLNGLLAVSQVARAQWEKDVQDGRHTGLLGDIGPAANLRDQLGLGLNLVLSKPQQTVERTLLGLGIGGDLKTVEAAVRAGNLKDIHNDFYRQMAERLQKGDFGQIGTQAARDKMMDEIAVNNQILRGAGDVPQSGFLTGQGLADMALMVATDPWIIGSLGLGALAKGASVARAVEGSKFLQTFTTEAMTQAEKIAAQKTVLDRSVELLAKDRRIGVPEAQDLFNHDSGAFHDALSMVAKQPEYVANAAEARKALTTVQRWHSDWAPALAPINRVVQAVNDPFRLFGIGHAGKAADTVASAHASEGVLRAFGLDNHVALLNEASAISPELGTALTDGLGVYTGNLRNFWMKGRIVNDIRRTGGLPSVANPNHLIDAGMQGLRGSDIATPLEMLALRVKPLYVALRRGGRGEALVRAQEQAANRLQRLTPNLSQEQAAALAGKLNLDQIAEVDAAYFGHTTSEFLSAQRAAAAAERANPVAGHVDVERLAILGPRELTEQRAKDVQALVKAKDVQGVREAMQQYDMLYENFAEGTLTDAEVLKQVGKLVDDQLKAGALAKDLPAGISLHPGLEKWAAENSDLGYKIGFKPDEEQLWRATTDGEGKVVGANPWVDLMDTQTALPTYTREQLARDRFFHAIRGERILMDARHAMADHTANHFGMSRGQSDALFARVVRLAQDSGITPRGMSPEQIYGIFTTGKFPKEVMAGLKPREAIEAVNLAFEGRLWHVGTAQKFTGALKTGLGGQGNFLGQLAERIYPTVRFAMNPLFQAQELVEPYFLNIMRGIKPGFRASELDETTLAVIHTAIRKSKYALDDQVERYDTLLWGADAAKQGFGPTTRLGKISKGFLLRDRLNVKELKRINYARAARQRIGIEFRESVGRVQPDLLAVLPAHYGTSNWGDIAIRYMADKAGLAGGDANYVNSVLHMSKPENLGARVEVNLDEVAAHFPDHTDGAAVRAAVADGRLSADDFRKTLTDMGADPAYVDRAYIRASLPDMDTFWKEHGDVFSRGIGIEAGRMRKIVQTRAAALGISEEEFIARRVAGVAGVDAADLTAMGANASAQFQTLKLSTKANERHYELTRAIQNGEWDSGWFPREVSGIHTVYDGEPAFGQRGAVRAVTIVKYAGPEGLPSNYLAKPVAALNILLDKNGKALPNGLTIRTAFEHQRTGQATALYRFAEAKGYAVEAASRASTDMSAPGLAFREHRASLTLANEWVRPGPRAEAVGEGDYAVRSDRGHAWDDRIYRGLSLGAITPQEATKLGWNPMGREADSIARLPDTIYHATQHESSVFGTGLKSREQAGLTGLGGGPENTISFTTDKELAHRVADVLVEARDVLNGTITPFDLMERAKAGGFWDKSIAFKWGGDVAKAEEAFARTFVRGNKVAYDSIMATPVSKLPAGAIPIEESAIRDASGKVTAYHSYEVAMTAAEKEEAAYEYYRAFLSAQENANRGVTALSDPMFFSANLDNLKNLDPQEVGVITAHPIPGAQGYQVGGMKEWRTWTGDAVTIERPSALYQKKNGDILGANILLKDSRRVLLATQHADRSTALHEWAHVFEADLDPSQRSILLDAYNSATKRSAKQMTPLAHEWFVEQFLNYVERGVTKNPEMRPALEYFRKWLRNLSTAKMEEKAGAGAVAAKATAVADARAAREVAIKEHGAATRSAATLGRQRVRATADLKNAKTGAGMVSADNRLRAVVTKHEAAKLEVTRLSKVLAKAHADLAKAQSISTRVRVRPVLPKVTPQVHDLFEGMFKKPAEKASLKSPVDLGHPFDLQQETVYRAGEMAVSRGEEEAFTLHYYKRGRSFLERSINHPYFGFYPASYMWGKILPEMIRFLVKEPFGIPAPLGGLALSNSVYRAVMTQQQFDPAYRQFMADNTPVWQLASLLTPALPWEIPVNAPLWLRRVAEADAIHQDKLATGDPTALLTPQQLGSIGADMMTYAFGPAQAIRYVGQALGTFGDLGDETFKAATNTIDGIFGAQTQPDAAPAEPALPNFTPGAYGP